MTLDNTINKIHTPCKDCVFAAYDDNTQNGCALNYLDTYKTNNIEILEAYDDKKEFYIINGKKCIGYRENKWFKQFDLEDASLEEKILKYKETNILDYIVVVDLKNISIESLSNLMKQVSLCDIKPKKIILIRYADNELKFPYKSIENILQDHNISCAWRIQTILDLSLDYKQILDNIVLLNSKNRFILCVNKDNSDLAKIVEKTNAIVHNDLGQFDIISNNDHSCLIFSGLIYRFQGFHQQYLLDMKDSYLIV